MHSTLTYCTAGKGGGEGGVDSRAYAHVCTLSHLQLSISNLLDVVDCKVSRTPILLHIPMVTTRAHMPLFNECYYSVWMLTPLTGLHTCSRVSCSQVLQWGVACCIVEALHCLLNTLVC
jgi:hypothetical protein